MHEISKHFLILLPDLKYSINHSHCCHLHYKALFYKYLNFLSLYFIIDNQLIIEQSKVNNLFDVVIEDISLQKEIRNLIIYKKALYNADNINENELLRILKPIINSESVWKSHALYLIAEFFYSKNEKKKSKEFFEKIITLENVNEDIITESRKRLNRDLSE